MNLRHLCLKLAVAVAVALCGAATQLYAQDGAAGALRSSTASSTSLAQGPFGRVLATADFDKDNKPDGAVLLDTAWLHRDHALLKIEVHLTGRPNTDLTFEASDPALAISALDVNRDGVADIVVEQSFTHKRLHVWLNDGRGEFHKVRTEDIPAPEFTSRARLNSPSPYDDSDALCLPQRGSDGVLSANALLLHAPRIAELRQRSATPSLAPARFSAAFPRGPPLS